MLKIHVAIDCTMFSRALASRIPACLSARLSGMVGRGRRTCGGLCVIQFASLDVRMTEGCLSSAALRLPDPSSWIRSLSLSAIALRISVLEQSASARLMRFSFASLRPAGRHRLPARPSGLPASTAACARSLSLSVSHYCSLSLSLPARCFTHCSDHHIRQEQRRRRQRRWRRRRQRQRWWRRQQQQQQQQQ
mgnify:CR=1 FL=1